MHTRVINGPAPQCLWLPHRLRSSTESQVPALAAEHQPQCTHCSPQCTHCAWLPAQGLQRSTPGQASHYPFISRSMRALHLKAPQPRQCDSPSRLSTGGLHGSGVNLLTSDRPALIDPHLCTTPVQPQDARLCSPSQRVGNSGQQTSQPFRAAGPGPVR